MKVEKIFVVLALLGLLILIVSVFLIIWDVKYAINFMLTGLASFILFGELTKLCKEE